MRYYYLPLAAAAARDLQWDDPMMMDASMAGGWDTGHADMGHWEDPNMAAHDPCDK